MQCKLALRWATCSCFVSGAVGPNFLRRVRDVLGHLRQQACRPAHDTSFEADAGLLVAHQWLWSVLHFHDPLQRC